MVHHRLTHAEILRGREDWHAVEEVNEARVGADTHA
jgi:hypothetical protein